MTNFYQQARFAFSVNQTTQLPTQAVAEIAFVGRSNSGKSSAINTLTGKTALARVSNTPGRTQLINYFSLPTEGQYLVDLPGYGYAQVPQNIREHWQKLLGDYLLFRNPLVGVVMIMDIRHPMKPLDIQLLDCCTARKLPVHILLTKADKLSKQAVNQQYQAVENALRLHQHIAVSVQPFSSLKKYGVDALINQLNSWLSPHHKDSHG